MARVNKANFKTYRDGETVTASEFNKIKDIFPEAINHIEDTLRDGQRLVDIENVNKEQDERLDSHDERQAQTEQHLEQLDTRCDEQDEVLANHEARITTATSENSRQDEVISNINERLREVEDNNADLKIVTVFANNVQKVETFVAEEGQQEFQLKKGHYIPGQNRIQLFVDGVQQTLDDGFMEINSATIRFTEPLKVGMKVTAHYFTEDTSDDLTDIMETIKEGPAILEGLVEKAEKIKADSILVQPTKPLPEDNCDIWFDTSEDDFFVIGDMEVTSVEGVALAQRLSELKDDIQDTEQKLDETNAQLSNVITKTNDFVVIENKNTIVDYTNILKNTLAYCVANNIRKIKFLNGDFEISEDIEIPTNFTIEGCNESHIYNGGRSITNIIFKNCDIGFNLKRNPYVTIKNITLDGNGSTNTVINFGYFTQLTNVTVTGGVISGGVIDCGQNSIYKNCSFSNNKTGLILNDVFTTTQTFENCYFRENSEYGVKGNTSDCYFLRCTFESNLLNGFILEHGRKLINFEYCYFEANEMPNGNHLVLKNGKYTFNGCDFGSTQIVTVANIINSTVEFRNCEYVGGKGNLVYTMDDNSMVISDNSFKDYQVDVRTRIVQNIREFDGECIFQLSESPDYIDVNHPIVLDKIPYSIILTPNCTEKMTVGVSNRTERGFRINIYDKPSGVNGSIFYNVKF